MAEASLSRAGAATLLAAAVAVEAAAPAGAAPLAALDVLVAVAFVLGAVAALPVSRSVGLLAYATAAAWILGTLAAGIEIPSYAADVAVLVHRAPLALLILIYPGRALHGTVIRGLAVAAVLAPFVPGTGGPAATAAVAGLVTATAVTRAARTPPALRAPEVAAAVVAGAIAAASAIAAADAAPATELLVAYDIVLVATATTLLVPLGKAHCHGGNIQAVTAPDGFPLWVSPVEPGSVHDLTAARIHALPALYHAAADLPTLADRGYEGVGIGVHIPVKQPPRGRELDVNTRTRNAIHRSLRCLGERGFALLTGRWRTLQHITAGPSKSATSPAPPSSSPNSNTATSRVLLGSRRPDHGESSCLPNSDGWFG